MGNSEKMGNFLTSFFIEDNYGNKFTLEKLGDFMFAIWAIVNAVFAITTITRNIKIAKAYYWWLSVIPAYTLLAIMVNVVRISYYSGFDEFILGDLNLKEFIANFSDLKLNFTYFTKDFLMLFISGLIVYLYGKTITIITNANTC